MVQSPPRRIQDRITWIQSSYQGSSPIPAPGSILELNFNFQLSSIPLASSWQALFDQYCIYSAHIRFSLGQTNPITASCGRIYTAIDYDSGAALGSSAALLGFGSSIAADLTLAKSYERFVKPCVTAIASGGSSSSPTGNFVTRSWCDTAFPAIPHFGIRSICDGNLGAAQLLLWVVTVVIGFRNTY